MLAQTAIEIPTWMVIASTVVSIIGAVWAIYERTGKIRLQKQQIADKDIQLILKLKDEINETANATAAIWKEKYDAKEAEFNEYRIRAHEQVNKANSEIMKGAATIAELQARTDYTPLMQAVSKISASQESTAKILQALYDKIVKSNEQESHGSR